MRVTTAAAAAPIAPAAAQFLSFETLTQTDCDPMVAMFSRASFLSPGGYRLVAGAGSVGGGIDIDRWPVSPVNGSGLGVYRRAPSSRTLSPRFVPMSEEPWKLQAVAIAWPGKSVGC